jgi:hypothetical protein
MSSSSLLAQSREHLTQVCRFVFASQGSSKCFRQSGQLQHLQQQLRDRLAECGWRDELREKVHRLNACVDEAS